MCLWLLVFQPVMFLVDTGSALTILRRDTWERCKKPDQQLVPWSQSRLIGAEGSQLHVFGSADMTLNLEGEKFDLCVVVIYPLTSEAILGLDILSKCTVDLSQQRLITGAGNVVNMSCQTKKVEWKYNHNKLEMVNTEACKDQCQAPENTVSVC